MHRLRFPCFQLYPLETLRPGRVDERIRLPLRPRAARATRLVQQSIDPLGNRDRTHRPGVHHLYPWGNEIFGTSPLPVWIFGPLALGAMVLLFAEESRKIIVKRFIPSRASGGSQQAGTL